MANNIVKTAQGKEIDIEALRLQNEDTIAVGNMHVNARGDQLSPVTGEVVKTRNERMRDYYKLHSEVPNDAPIETSAKKVKQPKKGN